jgi:hypothetical protein
MDQSDAIEARLRLRPSLFLNRGVRMFKRILVATDGSTLSRKAVSSAIDLAAGLGADLVALKVIPRYPES